jgi:hypothetical protein
MTCDKCHGHINTIGCKCEVDKLKAKVTSMRTCLQEIANADYRGNRHPLSVKAYQFLLSEADKQGVI